MISFIYKKLSIVLPNPKIGDNENLDLRIKVDRAMDGSPHTFIEGDVITQFRLGFEHLNRPQVMALEAFLKVVSGQTVDYIDMFGNKFSVAILTEIFTSVHEARRNNTFELVLEKL